MLRETLLILAASSASSVLLAQETDSSTITLERIFDSDFFDEARVAPIRWTADGNAYYSYDRRPDAKGPDLVRVDPATGEKTVLVRSEQLIPAGDTLPLAAQSFRFSEDGRKLLLFTNTARVWRLNTRGDYWVLDLDSASSDSSAARSLDRRL